nr:hypothetical protein OlV1_gene64 [Ostreococcus lucimarinus virus 1]
MPHWREEELNRLRKEYEFYKGTDCLRSETLKMVIDYHERMLGIKFWGKEFTQHNGHQTTN